MQVPFRAVKGELMPNRPSKEQLTIRVPQDLRQALEQRADQDGKKLTAVVLSAIRAYLGIVDDGTGKSPVSLADAARVEELALAISDLQLKVKEHEERLASLDANLGDGKPLKKSEPPKVAPNKKVRVGAEPTRR